MKLLAISLMSVMLFSCASKKSFKRKDVCSEASLSYLRDHKANYKKSDDKKVKKRMSKIESQVKACYKAEAKTSTTLFGKPTFNLCLVGGYDASGTQEHFEFSSKQYSMSDSFIHCLSVIKSSPDLKGLKNVSFMQPYRLSSKK